MAIVHGARLRLHRRQIQYLVVGAYQVTLQQHESRAEALTGFISLVLDNSTIRYGISHVALIEIPKTVVFHLDKHTVQ
jgi:hypothetical protein